MQTTGSFNTIPCHAPGRIRNEEGHDNKPVSVNYAITEYGLTLETVIKELSHWGNTHRIQLMGKV
ncbi:winged helix-turn-helix transcriptional regulator [Chitinophaga sancti]|uniref:winged helix-turn-helix transcriptional regulator n=1 Tax=Chitinophaga sancti TaxID=1004 RepID=UPI002A763350|nr:winged helix-turn-helix transcriptional regulator [Chitinophaga sancti]WPQ66396.1 winged helix-turn-helix transcriptional regulator [Chitinophaga sancti]